MGYLYIFTLIFLGITFLVFKKSDKELNLIKWICIFLVGIYAYNITICMLLGILHITQNIWLLSIINTVIGGTFLYKTIKKHECQKYKTSKLSIVSFLIILILFGVMFVKDLYIYKGGITHYVIDSAIHYRAAEHYSENLELFVFTEDKTFFDFNIMQTGAYINDGILMNVVNDITGLEKIYIYQIFETLTMFLGGLAFYSCFIDKIKTKRGLLGSLVLFALYMYGYPYNSWFYGFSYLSVGIGMTALLLSLVEMLYSEENIKKTLVISMIVIAGMGLMFSYCLFIPAIFTAICLYVFYKELNDKNTKKYLKIFGKDTLILTSLLLLVTAFGIGYLFIPSFIIEGQQNLVSALQEEGGIYAERYRNFIVYIPFAVMYIFELVKKAKNKELEYQDFFSVIVVGFLGLFLVGEMFDIVSQYYMLKIYFILWIVIFNIAIELVNKYINEKNIRIDIIILGLLYAFLIFKGVSPVTIIQIYVMILFAFYAFLGELIKNHRVNGLALVSVFVIYKLLRGTDFNSVFKLYMITFLVFYTVLPALAKKIDFSKLKNLLEKLCSKIKLKPICVSAYVYVTIWGLFVCGWVWIKAGHVIGEAEKHALPNLVGMYYTENCEYRKAMDVMQNFSPNNILITNYAKENLEDMTADNTILITEHVYRTLWSIATLEYDSDNMNFRNVVKATNKNNVQDALENQNIKYVIRLDPNDATKQEECKMSKQEIEEAENAEILYSNEHGFVARINR